MGRHLITASLIFISASCTIVGNLALKVGAERQGIGSTWPLTVVNGHIVSAAAAFVFAFLFYAMLLKRLPLNLAQAIMSLQFVLVILAAALLLGENVGRLRWLGVALMAIGLLIVGVSANVAPGEAHSVSAPE
jgi:undecaprenyl phosphate-alpha-L-ara4N flippase subunit ArnE